CFSSLLFVIWVATDPSGLWMRLFVAFANEAHWLSNCASAAGQSAAIAKTAAKRCVYRFMERLSSSDVGGETEGGVVEFVAGGEDSIARALAGELPVINVASRRARTILARRW